MSKIQSNNMLSSKSLKAYRVPGFKETKKGEKVPLLSDECISLYLLKAKLHSYCFLIDLNMLIDILDFR